MATTAANMSMNDADYCVIPLKCQRCYIESEYEAEDSRQRQRANDVQSICNDKRHAFVFVLFFFSSRPKVKS